MAPKIAVIPASTQAGREAIRALLHHHSNPSVHGIYRDVTKAPAEFTEHPNFRATQGNIHESPVDLAGAESVFYIPPPTWHDFDQAKFATQAATNLRKSLEDASTLKRLVLLSAMGSQYSHSIGILRVNHISDAILRNAAPDVIMMKAGYFQENWIHAFETARGPNPSFYSTVTPVDHKIPMVSIIDVGEICANKLLEADGPSTANPTIIDLYGPRLYSTLDVKDAIESVIGGKISINSVEKSNLAEFYAQKLPARHVQDMVDMTTAALPGGIMAGDFGRANVNATKGKIELVDTLRRLYKNYI